MCLRLKDIVIDLIMRRGKIIQYRALHFYIAKICSICWMGACGGDNMVCYSPRYHNILFEDLVVCACQLYCILIHLHKKCQDTFLRSNSFFSYCGDHRSIQMLKHTCATKAIMDSKEHLWKKLLWDNSLYCTALMKPQWLSWCDSRECSRIPTAQKAILSEWFNICCPSSMKKGTMRHWRAFKECGDMITATEKWENVIWTFSSLTFLTTWSAIWHIYQI